MPKKRMIVFDLDETLLISREANKMGINQVNKVISQWDPYQYGDVTCYTFHKKRMAKIFKKINEDNDYLFAIVTSGTLTFEKMNIFFKNEYGIEFPEGLFFYCNCEDKTYVLNEISIEYPEIEKQNIVLVDNSYYHTIPAIFAGFSAIHADTNSMDPENYPCTGTDETNGEVYIKRLETLVSGQEQAIEKDRLQSNAELSLKALEIHGVYIDKKNTRNEKKKDAIKAIAKSGQKFIKENYNPGDKTFTEVLKAQQTDNYKKLSLQRDRSRILGTFLLSVFSGGILALIGLIQFYLTGGRDFLLMTETNSEKLLRESEQRISAYRTCGL